MSLKRTYPKFKKFNQKKKRGIVNEHKGTTTTQAYKV